jgi:hypothetical protein
MQVYFKSLPSSGSSKLLVFVYTSDFETCAEQSVVQPGHTRSAERIRNPMVLSAVEKASSGLEITQILWQLRVYYRNVTQ